VKNALFIGRFQPFHLGHLDGLKQILEFANEFDNLILAIGSAEEDFAPRNPFTASERFQMILQVLRDEGIPTEKIFITPVRDVGRNSIWVHHLRKILPDFQQVFSGSGFVRHLFENEKDLAVHRLNKNLPICATQVREAILQGESWQELVPAAVKNFLEKIGAARRLEKIAFSK